MWAPGGSVQRTGPQLFDRRRHLGNHCFISGGEVYYFLFRFQLMYLREFGPFIVLVAVVGAARGWTVVGAESFPKRQPLLLKVAGASLLLLPI